MVDAIPDWIQTFVLVGIGLVILVVPIKVFYEMTKGRRERTRRFQEMADRLKERFGAVQFDRGILGPHRVHFTCDNRPVTMVQPDVDELAVRLEPKVMPRSHVLIRTRGMVAWPFTILWESLRFLPRLRIQDPLIDDSIDLYASSVFGGYLRELALEGASTEGKPSGIAESLVVLNRLPGVKKFECSMSPSGGFRIWFRLRSEDLLFRPDELEAAIHHAFQIYDALVLT